MLASSTTLSTRIYPPNLTSHACFKYYSKHLDFISLFSWKIPFWYENKHYVLKHASYKNHSQFKLLNLIFIVCRFYFDFSTIYVGVGMICPYIINVSVLLGGILSWGVMWPLIKRRKGQWYPANLPDSDLSGLQGYKVSFLL